MRIAIRDGGDGVACWNGEAIGKFVDRANEREHRIASTNPDVDVLAGEVKCYGCEVLEWGYGTKCTAQHTKTRYAVRDEIEPRAADATGSLLEIEGLETLLPGSKNLNPNVTHARAEPESESAPARRGGLRGLLGR